MSRNDYTGLLYSQPSFTAGLGRVLDVGGTFDAYNESASATEADQIALASDWYAVGADLYRAIIRFAARVDRPVSHGE
jgi:hypothetical protein